MRTEDLIAALSADTRVQPPLGPVAGLALAATLGLGALGLVLTLGLRADLRAILSPFVALKTLLPLVLGGLALALALRRVQPAVGDGRLPLGLWAGLGVLVLAMLGALMITEPQSWDMQMRGKTIWACLIAIPTLSALPLAAVLLVLRRGAALRPGLAGFAAGLSAGALSASLYSLHCIEDSPLFYGLWYSLAVLGVALLGAALGRIVLRW